MDSEDDRLIRGFLEGGALELRQVDRWIRMVVDNRRWQLSYQREDILQEVRRRLLENLRRDRFKREAALKTYVVQIAKYTCIEFLREKIRSSTPAPGVPQARAGASPDPEEQLQSAEREQLAEKAFRELPEPCRRLFQMIFLERLPYDEISRRLGIAEGTVKSRASRCRDLLRKELASLSTRREEKHTPQTKRGNLTPGR